MPHWAEIVDGQVNSIVVADSVAGLAGNWIKCSPLTQQPFIVIASEPGRHVISCGLEVDSYIRTLSPESWSDQGGYIAVTDRLLTLLQLKFINE